MTHTAASVVQAVECKSYPVGAWYASNARSFAECISARGPGSTRDALARGTPHSFMYASSACRATN